APAAPRRRRAVFAPATGRTPVPRRPPIGFPMLMRESLPHAPALGERQQRRPADDPSGTVTLSGSRRSVRPRRHEDTKTNFHSFCLRAFVTLSLIAFLPS